MNIQLQTCLLRVGHNGFHLRLNRFLQSWIRGLFTKLPGLARHPLFRLTAVGLAIRLVLTPITQFTYDAVVWYSTGNDMLAGQGLYYAKTYSYPPFWAYTYFPFLLIASLLADPRTFATHVSQMDWISLSLGYSPTILSPVSLVVIKLPLIIGDVATGFLLFRFMKTYSGPGLARKAYVFWLFNPIVIWTSAVHGTLDVLPAMFTLLAFVLLVESKYLQSGISISIATLYKLYPLYLVPLYAILVWTHMGKERSFKEHFRPKVQRMSLFVGGGFLPFLAVLPFVSTSNLLHAVSTRQAYLSSMGGLSPWMLNYAPGFGWMWDFASKHLTIIDLATTSLSITVSTLAGWTLVRKGPTDVLGVVNAHVLAVSAIYLTLVTVNPQYVLWILPFLMITMFASGVYRKRGMLLAALAMIWQLTISGTLVFMPLYYFGLPTQLLTAPVESILITFQPSFNPILLVCGLGGGIVITSFVVEKRGWLALTHFHIPLDKSHFQLGSKNLGTSTRTPSTYALVAFVIALSLSAVFTQTPPTERIIPVGLDSTLSGNLLTTRNSFVVDTGHLPLQLSLVAAPVASLRADLPVFIYYDSTFPSLGNDARGWIGVLDHLPAELKLRGYTGQVQTVDAMGMRQLMLQDLVSVIIVPSGVFPSTVQNATVGLVASWLRTGGVLVWMGGPFGFYSNPMTKNLDPLTTNMSIAITSQQNILGYRLTEPPLNGTSRIATINTRFSSALNLTYSDAWVAPTARLIRSLGGMTIGHLQSSSDTSRSSLSIVPVGLGKIILFGGPVTNLLTADGEDVIAHDAAQVLSLGDLMTNTDVEFATFSIPAAESISLSFAAAFNVTSVPAGVVILGFSDYSFSRLFWRTEVAARATS